jgi:hypothetical protein
MIPPTEKAVTSTINILSKSKLTFSTTTCGTAQRTIKQIAFAIAKKKLQPINL